MKILVLTDMDSNFSGYRAICAPLFTKLSEMGYEVKIVGLSNRGDEHPYPFSILPATNLEEANAIAGNVLQLWQPQIFICAMDLPVQAIIKEKLNPHLQEIKLQDGTIIPAKKYIAITPLENGPLCLSWAAPLFNMNAVFFISELGKQEALKVGVQAEHLQVGVDTVSWRPAFDGEKEKLREGLGIPQDAFVVLTVADNQERKNLWAGMEAVARLKKEVGERPVRYILVTREQSPFGWKLRDLAVSLGINQEYMCFERGMPQKDLWALYAVADIYLQPSKAEGLGLPVLDAMCCKIPVVATDTGAMHELLIGGKGLLVPPAYEFTDVWGNEKRSMIDVELLKKNLFHIISEEEKAWSNDEMTSLAYEYVTRRTWDIPAKQISDKIRELIQ